MYMSDNKDYPVGLSVPHPAHPSRLLALTTLLLVIKPILLIPHFIVFYLLSIFATLAGFIAQAVVLFTGKYPRGFFLLVKSALQWQLRMNSFMYGLVDEYPPFDLGVDDKKEAWKALWWMVGVCVVILIVAIIVAATSNQ